MRTKTMGFIFIVGLAATSLFTNVVVARGGRGGGFAGGGMRAARSSTPSWM